MYTNIKIKIKKGTKVEQTCRCVEYFNDFNFSCKWLCLKGSSSVQGCCLTFQYSKV